MTGKKVSNFRDRFCELIESCPKSRTQISQEFGVAKQTISAWITGQSSPRLPVVTALAEYFGVNIEWLMGFDVPKYVDKKVPDTPPEDNIEKLQTIEARILARGIDSMPAEQREQALNIMKTVFIQYKGLFEKENNNDDA